MKSNKEIAKEIILSTKNITDIENRIVSILEAKDAEAKKEKEEIIDSLDKVLLSKVIPSIEDFTKWQQEQRDKLNK
jgi:hypothetical protein